MIMKKSDLTKSTDNLSEKIVAIFDNIMDCFDETVFSDFDTLSSITNMIENAIENISKSPNGKLWIQYMKMVDILRSVIRAQRTGNFTLYIKALQNMLPFFASSGHNNYTKSVNLYIQDMCNLKVKNPTLYSMIASGHLFVRRSDRFWAALPTDLIIEQVLMKSVKSQGGLTHGRGMEEVQRTRWLKSMPIFAHINNEMENMYKDERNSTCKGMSNARRKRDRGDFEIINEYFIEHDPFVEREKLFNISSGISSPNSNAHHAEDIGEKILQKMKDQKISKFVFRKKDQIITMSERIIAGNIEVSIDPQLLFQRLLIIASNTEIDLDELFKYELSIYPPSLFEGNGLLNLARKNQLSDSIAKKIDSFPEPNTINAQSHVIDGGSLIHRFEWKKGETFEEIMRTYVRAVKNFVNPIVIIDGYNNTMSTKSVAHARRAKGSVPEAHISPNLSFTLSNKSHFLANHKNKQAFITMLSKKMSDHGIVSMHADGDADVLIAETACNLALDKVTCVIAEDTDILVLLCHHLKPEALGLFMVSEKRNAKYPIWNVLDIQTKLGLNTCRFLPFLHAIGGSDTTSRLYGIGKGVVFKKLGEILEYSEPFLSKESDKEIIRVAGEKIISILYGGQAENLDRLRKKKFSKMAVKSFKSIVIQNLPPTSNSAQFHSYRVYYQTQVWMGNNDLCPENYGWKINGGELIPVTTTLSPAPDTLLKMIRCQCKGSCMTSKCSCKKQGLYCTDACAECTDGPCKNIITHDEIPFQYDDDFNESI